MFAWATMLVAIALSAVAAYYSILGLTAIFAAAFWPVVIMGVALEAGKIMAAVWLHRNWFRAGMFYRGYLTVAVAVLMLLTSMGIFGFLSKAHLDQAVPLGEVAQQVGIIDAKIQTQRDNIEASRRALSQMDASVDQILSRSTTEQGAERSAQLRRQQGRERQQLQQDIQRAQEEIARLSAERAPVANQLRQVEAEVGPIKYVAALIYGDDPDENLLESAVRWVIILIVLVFDPLAIALILAAQRQRQWDQSENLPTHIKEDIVEEKENIIDDQNSIIDDQDNIIKDQNDIINTQEHFIKDQTEIMEELRAVVSDTLDAYQAQEQRLAASEAHIRELEERLRENEQREKTQESRVRELENQLKENEERNETQDLFLARPDGHSRLDTNAGFGRQFPLHPRRGDYFLRVDYVPTRLYKWNGARWVEVDKQELDGYHYSEGYIQYLMAKLATNEYRVEDLADNERHQIVTYQIKVDDKDDQE